jgi:hypothetical protein
MDLGEVGCGDVDWIGLAQDKDQALVNAVMNLPIPQNARRLLSGCTTSSISSCAQPHRVSLTGMFLSSSICAP